MDPSRLILSPFDELRQIRGDTRLCNSLDEVRRNFDRLQEIRRQYVDDFDLQILIADAQHDIIERARFLRKDPEVSTATRSRHKSTLTEEAVSDLEPARPLPPSSSSGLPLPDETTTAEIPSDVPKLDRRSFQVAIGMAVLFTVGILAAFFYLIQTARRLNFQTEAPAIATQPQTPAGAKPAGAASAPKVSNVVPPSISMTPTLRLYTDLTGGIAVIDDQSPKDLTDGELSIDSLAPGSHSVRIEGRSGSAAFTFVIDRENNIPRVTNILKSNNAMLVLVSAKDGAASLYTDATGAQVYLDQKPAGEVPSDGLLLSDLGNADHDLEVSQARDRQRFVLTYTPAPTLTVFVKSDPSTGVLTVSTGMDGVSIIINDLPYKRLTDHGAVRIPLKVGSYRIKVHKVGFEDPAIAMVDVKKSAEASVQFHLQPLPQVSTLSIKGAQPGTVAYIDHQVVGTVGPDGTAKIATIKPGLHIIELHHDLAITKELGRTFEAGQTVTLSGADVALDRLAADNKSVIPANPSATVIAPPEVPQLPPVTGIPGEQVHKGGGFIPYHTSRAPGHYYFQAHGKIGGILKRGKLQWYAGYQNGENYFLFSLDGKHAEVKEVREGRQVDLGKVPFPLGSDEWVQVDLTVNAGNLQARAKTTAGDWTSFVPVNIGGHDFTKEPVGIYVPQNDEVAIANFRFTGH